MLTKMGSSKRTFTLMIVLISTMILVISIASLPYSVSETTILKEDNSRRFNFDPHDEEILEDYFDDEYDDNIHSSGRVFYSHSMMMYGTQAEGLEKNLIRQRFSDFGIISAKDYQGDPEKNVNDVEFYKRIVSGCQIVVYSKWNGDVVSGVLIEVNHAIDNGIPVFELVDNEFIPRKTNVEGLSYEETTKRYEDYRTYK
jgi:hypothetical protein